MAKGSKPRGARAGTGNKARRGPAKQGRALAAKRMTAKKGARANVSSNGGLFAGLGPNAANFSPLTPISFLPRTAAIHPDRLAVVHGTQRYSYSQFQERVRRLASALARRGVRPGETVSVMLPNVPAMVEAHFGVPMLGAVLNAINTRLDAPTIAYILKHGEARVLITDREYAAHVGPALARLKKPPLVIDVDDPLYPGPGERLGTIEYEDFIAAGDPGFTGRPVSDESGPIALNYTSGTTGNPKGVVYHHRGTFLKTVGNTMAWPLPPRPIYLWTLPMFHCNGWCFTWSVTAMGGTHICLRNVAASTISSTF
jgi:fatty-acyl-CoA synthase